MVKNSTYMTLARLNGIGLRNLAPAVAFVGEAEHKQIAGELNKGRI